MAEYSYSTTLIHELFHYNDNSSNGFNSHASMMRSAYNSLDAAGKAKFKERYESIDPNSPDTLETSMSQMFQDMLEYNCPPE